MKLSLQIPDGVGWGWFTYRLRTIHFTGFIHRLRTEYGSKPFLLFSRQVRFYILWQIKIVRSNKG